MAKHPGGGEKAGSTHRWAVDRVEEGTAAVEQDGDHVYELPRWLLPRSVRDGDVLTASAAAAGDGSVTITVRFDEDATGAAKTPRSKRPRSARDTGGDIAL